VPKSLENGDLISDYTFEKDALFARLNLNGDELNTYTLVHDALGESIVRPDLTVFLKVDTDTAMQRIAMRDRAYERNMERAYIDSLNHAYEAFFSRQSTQNVLTIDTNNLDYVSRKEHLESVANRIRDALGIPPFQPELPMSGEQLT
jgi:deoxyguanosine kinase